MTFGLGFHHRGGMQADWEVNELHRFLSSTLKAPMGEEWARNSFKANPSTALNTLISPFVSPRVIYGSQLRHLHASNTYYNFDA